MIDQDRQIRLPECGMFLGTGMYYSRSGYLSLSGTAFTTWLSHDYTPLELLERVIEENQGNMVQLWGFSGGAPAGTDRYPTIFAQYHALEDLGITAPEPDWENYQFLTTEDWPGAASVEDRLGAGAVKFVKRAAEKGIYTLLIYTEATPEWAARLCEAGEFYLGYDFGERFSFRLAEEHLKEGGSQAPTLNDLGAQFMNRVSDHIVERREQGWGRIVATSANFYLDYEVAAGVDVPLTEDFAFKHLNVASALSRGLYRQYQLPLWGSHIAHEHYSWLPYSNPYKFPLLRAALFHKMMAGSKMMINESGTWDQQARLCVDAPMNALPSVEFGAIHHTDPYQMAHHTKQATVGFDSIGPESEVCQQYRRVISDFYDYLKANGTPAGQPESRIAVIKGNGDLSSEEYHPNLAIGGMYSRAEEDPRWLHGAPELGWQIIKETFFPRPPVLGDFPNHFLSGTPLGMVDIVSFANDHVSADFLSEHYQLLLFAGWNTASYRQYDELLRYVRSGGTIFLSIPHLSTNATRNYTSYQLDELLHNGDFSALCGVRVVGRGKRFYWATAAPGRSGELGFEFPRRFGIMATSLGEIEITDPATEVLVVEDETMAPLLIRRKLGEGTVYFLNSWAYPGALNSDDGPGCEQGRTGLIGAIYRYLAEQHQGTFSISANGQDIGKGCERIAYSYFPEAGKVCLQNVDFDAPQHGYLHRDGERVPFTLEAGGFHVIPA